MTKTYTDTPQIDFKVYTQSELAAYSAELSRQFVALNSDGRLHWYDQNGDYHITSVKNQVSTINPTVNDDEDSGFAQFSRWLNEDTGTLFLLVDPSSGVADWRPAVIINNSDDISEGTTHLFLTGAERLRIVSSAEKTVIENITAGKPAKEQIVTTAAADVASNITRVSVRTDTITDESTITILTTGIVAGRIIEFADTGDAADVYTFTITCEGSETINGATNLKVQSRGASIKLYCRSTTELILMR